jgi:hypothetical protein
MRGHWGSGTTASIMLTSLTGRLECDSVAKHLPRMCKAPGSIPSAAKRQNKIQKSTWQRTVLGYGGDKHDLLFLLLFYFLHFLKNKQIFIYF